MTDGVASPSPNVVVIEDEAQIRRFIRTALEAEHCFVTEAKTAERGIIEARTRKPDLSLVDLGLPDRDGIDVIRAICTWSTLPILILSAGSLESEKVRALDAGADAYLTKPFGIAELQARVRALWRRAGRSGAGESPSITLGDIRVDTLKRHIWKGDTEVRLTPVEYRLLAHLIQIVDESSPTANCYARSGGRCRRYPLFARLYVRAAPQAGNRPQSASPYSNGTRCWLSPDRSISTG